jgi:hypothetical protein
MAVVMNGRKIAKETFDRIDARLSNEDSVIPVVWNPEKARWEYAAGTWNEHLGIPNSYYVEKCKLAGVGDDETLKRIETWGSLMFKDPEVIRRKGDENYLDTVGRHNPQIRADVKASLENYSKVQRRAIRDIYNNCDLLYRSPERQGVREDTLCQNTTCGEEIFTQGDVDRVPPDDEKLSKILRCRDIGSLCRSNMTIPTEFNRGALEIAFFLLSQDIC